jgi:hypothetical protein
MRLGFSSSGRGGTAGRSHAQLAALVRRTLAFDVLHALRARVAPQALLPRADSRRREPAAATSCAPPAS